MATTLPALGAISIGDYNSVLNNAAGTQLSMNDTSFRNLAGVPGSGATIRMTDGYGKANRVAIAIKLTGTTYNYNLRNNMPGNYVAGKSDIVLTVDYGAAVGSTSTGSPGMTISGFINGDTVKVINYGKIVGAGGAGGRGANSINGDYVAYPGGAGGTALSVGFYTSFENYGVVGGGGGGGGGGQLYWSYSYYYGYYFWGGHGGGGGQGLSGGAAGGGGTGGSPYNGSPGPAGTAGTIDSAGTSPATSGAYQGGGGGALGAAGGTGLYCYNGVCNVSPYNYGGAGGAGGACTAGNSNINWVATGLRYGALN